MIPDDAVEAAWGKLAEALDCDPEDRGVYEVELIAGVHAALEAAAPHMLAAAWDEGAEAQAKCYGMDKDTGRNPYRIQT